MTLPDFFIVVFFVLLSAALSAQEPITQSPLQKPSEQLQSAIDLLNNTEASMQKQQEQIENLLIEIAESKKDSETLESLRQEALKIFDQQSISLRVSNQSLRRWKSIAIFGVPAALAAGLISGLALRR